MRTSDHTTRRYQNERAVPEGLGIRIGVSACLLGRQVRYDGGHKRDSFLVDVLGPQVEWVPVCPEVELGMGTPRPAVRLEDRGAAVALVEPVSGEDHTGPMLRLARQRVRGLRDTRLCGFVLKRGSPSCGLGRVAVWREGRVVRHDGAGLFATALTAALPELPVEEEGRLADVGVRERFVERLFARRRLHQLFRPRWTAPQVVAFHAAHALQLATHSPSPHRALAESIAALPRLQRAAFRARYEVGLMAALARPAPRARHVAALRRAARALRRFLSSGARGELDDAIQAYRDGRQPRRVPLTLIRDHAREHAVDPLRTQTYLDPQPSALLQGDRR